MQVPLAIYYCGIQPVNPRIRTNDIHCNLNTCYKTVWINGHDKEKAEIYTRIIIRINCLDVQCLVMARLGLCEESGIVN